jgi:hypothetical protein
MPAYVAVWKVVAGGAWVVGVVVGAGPVVVVGAGAVAGGRVVVGAIGGL